MSSRVTDLDRHIAARMRAFREANPNANMASLARFLGIKYQSYQAMEKGEVSLRVSTVERLATFYGVGVQEFIGSEVPMSVPNIDRISYVVAAMKEMGDSQAREALSSVLAIRRGA